MEEPGEDQDSNELTQPNAATSDEELEPLGMELDIEELESVPGGAMGMRNGKPFGVYATWPIPPDELYQLARKAKADGQTYRRFFHTYNAHQEYPNLYPWLRAQWPCMQ